MQRGGWRPGSAGRTPRALLLLPFSSFSISYSSLFYFILLAPVVHSSPVKWFSLKIQSLKTTASESIHKRSSSCRVTRAGALCEPRWFECEAVAGPLIRDGAELPAVRPAFTGSPGASWPAQEGAAPPSQTPVGCSGC